VVLGFWFLVAGLVVIGLVVVRVGCDKQVFCHKRVKNRFGPEICETITIWKILFRKRKIRKAAAKLKKD